MLDEKEIFWYMRVCRSQRHVKLREFIDDRIIQLFKQSTRVTKSLWINLHMSIVKDS